MKIYSILASLISASALPVYSASIDFSSGTDTGFAIGGASPLLSIDDIPLDTSYTAFFGTYSGGTLTTTSTFDDINPNFSVLTSQTFASGDAAGFDGYVILNQFNFTDLAGFGGEQLFVFVTDGANQNALISGFGQIPNDGDTPNTLSVTLDSTLAPLLTYNLGSYDPSSPNSQSMTGGNIVLNNAVPEPSAVLLSVIGSLALLRRKR